MGWVYSEHIKVFCEGKTIEKIFVDGEWSFIEFTNGEKLRMYVYGTQILCTPLDKNGEVKQSTSIMEGGD